MEWDMRELFAIQAVDDASPLSTRDPSVRIFAPNYLSLITGCPIYLVNESRERASEVMPSGHRYLPTT